MKMKMNMAVAGLAALLITTISANAASYGPIGVQEGALWGANYLVQISEGDLTNTVTNSAQTISSCLSVVSNSAVEMVALVVDTPADSGNTNYTGSTLLKIGDGDDDDRYLTSTELNVDGTEVWFKLGPPNGGTITVTPSSVTLTTMTYAVQTASGITNPGIPAVVATGITASATTYLVATNATASLSASELGHRVYTVNDTVDFVFTPNAEESLSALSNLSFRAYFKVTPPGQ